MLFVLLYSCGFFAGYVCFLFCFIFNFFFGNPFIFYLLIFGILEFWVCAYGLRPLRLCVLSIKLSVFFFRNSLESLVNIVARKGRADLEQPGEDETEKRGPIFFHGTNYKIVSPSGSKLRKLLNTCVCCRAFFTS